MSRVREVLCAVDQRVFEVLRLRVHRRINAATADHDALPLRWDRDGHGGQMQFVRTAEGDPMTADTRERPTVEWEAIPASDDPIAAAINTIPASGSVHMVRSYSAIVRASVDGGEPRTPAEWLNELLSVCARLELGGALERSEYRHLSGRKDAAFAALRDLLGGPDV